MKRAFSLRTTAPWLALGVSALAYADVERTCIGGIGVIERWPVIPGGGIVLDLARGIGSSGPLTDTRPAPGLPNSHVYQANCSIPFDNLPIQQSIARAANTWNSAMMPGTTALASTFAINPSVTQIGTYPDWWTYNNDPFNSSLLRVDGRNQVTFWEPVAVWNALGGTTLAIALVELASGSGNIIDCDIAFNAGTSAVGGSPLFRFIEDNLALGATLATKSYPEMFGTAVVGVEPVIGYVDLHGAFVHELGHLAGLAHSLIDGQMSRTSSVTPSMFAVGQVQPFNAPIVRTLSGCSNHTTTNANGAATAYGGIMGIPARDLAQDDIAAISVAYPGPGQAQLGAIVGRVLNTAGQPLRGAHVVAINAAAPELGRIGTFSTEQGNYRVGSLPPGTYWLMVERFDPVGYFFNTAPPEYVDPAFCGNPAPFETEFLDALESANEATPLAAIAITVTAGANTPVADVLVEPLALRLTARSCSVVGGTNTCTVASIRGTVHNDLGGSLPTLSLDLIGGTPGGVGALALGVDRAYLPFSGQLLEVNALPGATITFGLDGTGAGNVTLPVGPNLVGTTFFAQVAEFNPGNGFITLTNTVALRLDAL